MAVVAGLAQLELLTPDAYARLHELGERAKQGVQAVGTRLGVDLSATGVGHLFTLHWNPKPIFDYADHRECDYPILAAITAGLVERGYACGTMGRCHLSTAMTDADIDGFVDALADTIGHLPAP